MATDLLSSAPPSIPTKPPIILQEKGVAVAGQLVSIVIPCCGTLEYTEMCVPSILKHTRMPYELIFLDIGSLDGTAPYLRGLATGLANMRLQVVRTPSDLGIAQAVKEALEMCRGDFIVLLSNDTIVTRGWVNQLIGLMSQSAGTGMVGPMSNYATELQLVEAVPYRSGPRKSVRPAEDDSGPRGLIDLDAVQAFADELREKNKGKYVNVDRLDGFCLMLKREVLRRLNQQGELSKLADLSVFDKGALSAKARQLGYTLAICRDLFVHHFGTMNFAQAAPAMGNGQTAAGFRN